MSWEANSRTLAGVHDGWPPFFVQVPFVLSLLILFLYALNSLLLYPVTACCRFRLVLLQSVVKSVPSQCAEFIQSLLRLALRCCSSRLYYCLSLPRRTLSVMTSIAMELKIQVARRTKPTDRMWT